MICTCFNCKKEFEHKFLRKHCSPECYKAYSVKRAKERKESHINSMTPDQLLQYRKELNYLRYIDSAVKRQIDFNLPFVDAISMWDNNCYYCGDKIDGLGIDRVNNSIGYQIGNVVPCCTMCNGMKFTKTKNDFINQCHKISNYHGTNINSN